METVLARMAQITHTTAEWASTTTILEKGEIAYEVTTTGEYLEKVGDGVRQFSELPYAPIPDQSVLLRHIGSDLEGAINSLYIDHTKKYFISMPSDAASFTSRAVTGTTYVIDKEIPSNTHINTISFYCEYSGTAKLKLCSKNGNDFTVTKEFDVNASAGLNTININYVTTSIIYIALYFPANSNASIYYMARKPADYDGYFYQYTGEGIGTFTAAHQAVSLDWALSIFGMDMALTLDEIKYDTILTVGSGCQYSRIADAINAANDSSTNPITIIVFPGIYKEVVRPLGQRYLSIIGINRETCILRDDSGVYNNAPLRISGNCYVANLSIVSTHNDNPAFVPNDSNVSTWPSYALHLDDINNGSGIAHIHNCYLYSENAPAAGCGGQVNQTLKLTDCEIINNISDDFYNASTKCHNGALFLHPKWDNTAVNQKFILKNCIIKSNRNEVFVTETATAANNVNMKMSFYNNILYSDTLGKSSSIFLNNTPESQITGDSFGNNVTTMNA